MVYGVTIFEKYNSLGGILVHGIPEFRLNTKVVEESIKNILDLGVDVKYNKELGKDFKLEELKKDYDAIFLATGANKSAKMGVEGENLKGVYGGNELLEKNIHPEYQGKVVAVIVAEMLLWIVLGQFKVKVQKRYLLFIEEQRLKCLQNKRKYKMQKKKE